tara:strand:- start:1155 stop:1643 length:489 start_codon:yes stop_codon:yes gene_type:complete
MKNGFNKLIKERDLGLKRKITSRRLKLKISIEEFADLTTKYFLDLKSDENIFKIKLLEQDKETLLFILRVYYKLWIEVDEYSIKIYNSFPEKFTLTKEVNKSNHYFTPETFKKGTIMYSISGSYSSANRMAGVPLWKNLEPIEGKDLIPSVQINYSFITPLY